MSDVTNLRQAKNKVEVMGILAEKDIHPAKNAANQKECLEGYVSIKIDEINQIRIRVSADVTKKDGTENPAYVNLKGFNENAVSIAEGGLENASRVMSNSVQLNPYYSAQSGKDVLGYRTGFISVFRGSEEDWEPKAEASVELYIKAIVPEMNNDEETGRLLLKGIMPTFNGVEPLTLIIPKEIADDFESGYEVGQTAEFFADVINNRVEKITEIPVRLGKPKIEKVVEYTNELVVTGASDPFEEEKAYDREAIKLALAERDERIKNAANKPRGNAGGNGGQSRPSGASMGRKATW